MRETWTARRLSHVQTLIWEDIVGFLKETIMWNNVGGYCGDFEGDNVKMNLAEQDRPPPPRLKMSLSAAPPPAGFLVSTRPPFKQNSLYFDCVTLGGTRNLWHTCHAWTCYKYGWARNTGGTCHAHVVSRVNVSHEWTCHIMDAHEA